MSHRAIESLSGAAGVVPAWRETYRGSVFPWQVDIVGHFTVAYYFERFEDATLAMLEALGLGPAYMARTGQGCVTDDCYVRYLHELRAGDVLHIESGVLAVESEVVRLGHRLFDSATGALCATMEQRAVHRALPAGAPAPLPEGARQAAGQGRVPWDGPVRERRPRPVGLAGFLDSARDTVKPFEIDVFGQSGWPFAIHRFSAAGIRAFAEFGMTPAYMRDAHRGFSTFEFQLRFLDALRAGELVRVRTCVAHVGSSSVRVFHRMFREPDGMLVAELDQFGVHLDTDARRPAPLPPPLRERAQALLARVTLDGGAIDT
jgi:acyl-CoA thioesterase FadM